MSNVFSFFTFETVTQDVNEDLLKIEINESNVSVELMNFIKIDQTINLVFSEILTPQDIETLQLVVHAHQGLGINLVKSISQNKEFSDNMLQRLKEKNISDGLLSIDTAAWLHHRFRKADYQLSSGVVVQIDVLNLVVSGDIETAEQVLGQMTPDNMTENYHWLTQERIDWIRNEIRTYLGWPIV